MPSNWQRWKGIMKCYPFEEKRLLKWKPPYIVQIKYDGDRCSDVPLEDGNHLLLTSEENPFFSVSHINEALFNLNSTLKLDGELYSHNLHLEGGHELIHSIASRTVNIHPRYNEMEFYISDMKDKTISQDERIMTLHKIKDYVKPPLVIAPFWICNTLSEIKKIYDNIIRMKYEGIIVRNIEAPYIEKRSIWVMKFKPKKKDTYKIVGWKEEVSEDGIPKGRLGSVVCSSQRGDTFSVSAGLDDSDREHFWTIREDLAGKDCIVHYQHLTNKQIPKGTFDIEIL